MNSRFFLLWLAALLLRPAAQSDGLTLSARAGFDGLYRESAAVPVIVSARNEGPPLEGEIRVTVGSAAAGNVTVYSAPISLPTQSDKRVALYVHLPPFAGDLNVQLVSDERVAARANTNALTVAPRDDLLYGVVTPEPGGLAFLETVAVGRPGADVAFLDLADLPDVSIAWNALDVLVLDDTDTSRLSARQLSALRAWVENGGQLVVTGGPGGPKTAAGVADLLPVTLAGVETVGDLPALSDFAGEALAAPGPYTVAGSALRQGELLIRQEDLPLLARAKAGLGAVTFLALDPKLAPLAGWAGHDALWSAIAGAAPDRAPWGNGVQDGYAAAQAVSSIAGLRLPSLGQLLLFLFVYTLVIGPVNFLVLRRLKRPELAWVTIPALVLLFGAATYFTSFGTRGDTAVLNEMSVAYGSIEAGRVRTQTVAGLYSPRRGQYDLALPYDATAYPFAEGFGAILGETNLEAIVRAGDLTLRGVRTDTSQIATFITDAHLPRPPLSGTARLVDDGAAVAVTVRNDGPATLENAVLVYGQQQQALGNVAPGEERAVQLALAPATAPAGPGGIAPAPPDPLFAAGSIAPNPLVNDPTAILGTPDYYNDPDVYPRWQLIQSLYYSAESGVVRPPEPTEAITLGGWLPGSAQAIATDATANAAAVTLVLLEIPVR